MSARIDAVIVDTSAFVKLNCDFCGINNSVIPMFFELLSDNNIKLLTHPILYGEIKKHIKESSLVMRVAHLCDDFIRCGKQMQIINVFVEKLQNRSACSEIEEKLLSSYNKSYNDAEMLPVGDALSVFDEYYNSVPPFKEKEKKKYEFPDAFVLRGLWEYCELHPKSNVLVISDDGDWKDALEKYANVACVDTINAALNLLWSQLEYKDAFIASLLDKSKALIAETVEKIACDETYSIPAIGDLEELLIETVRVKEVQDYYTILDVQEDRVTIQISIVLCADGEAKFIDEERSGWDSDCPSFIIPAYTQVDFKNASSEVECEVTINFPPKGAEGERAISSAKLVYDWDIELELDEDKTDYYEMDDDDRDYDQEPISIKQLVEDLPF